MLCSLRTYSPDHPTCKTCPFQDDCGPKEAKPPKYHNQKIVVDNETFDSKKEYQRCCELRMLERAGKIQGLKRQVPFELAPAVKIKGRLKPSLRYIGDFTYTENGIEIVEDVKSPVTRKEPLYRAKIHLMKTVHGVDIKET